MSFVTAKNHGEMGMALFEPEIKFDLAFVFRRGKDQIPRINSF